MSQLSKSETYITSINLVRPCSADPRSCEKEANKRPLTRDSDAYRKVTKPVPCLRLLELAVAASKKAVKPVHRLCLWKLVIDASKKGLKGLPLVRLLTKDAASKKPKIQVGSE